jgi:predicted nucleic acid-binding protein
MAFVLDASIAGCWAFKDEHSETADAALARLEHARALVPVLWWFEVRNLVIVNERRARITPTETETYFDMLADFRIMVDNSPDSDALLRLARSRRLTIYDAAYLELAMRRNVPLATLDSRLADAAKCEGIDVVT